jgi:ubiquinone/menaquinone biosynthesis C-methylase UbiE
MAFGDKITVGQPMTPEAAYDLAAPFYDDWKWQRFWRSAELPFIRDCLSTIDLPAGPGLLDVGCGTGWYLRSLQNTFVELAGVDVSAGMLARARARLPQADLRQADMRHLPFGDARFDVVLSTRVLSHLPEPRDGLREIVRVLRKPGWLIVSNVDAEHDYEHTRLPISDGHVIAETYKHSRLQLQDLLLELGLHPIRSALISEDGEVQPTTDLHAPIGKPVAGWITAWRRPA